MLAPAEVTNGSFIYLFVTALVVGVMWMCVYTGTLTSDSAKYVFLKLMIMVALKIMLFYFSTIYLE